MIATRSLCHPALIARLRRPLCSQPTRFTAATIERLDIRIPEVPQSPAFPRAVRAAGQVWVSGTGAGNDIGGTDTARHGTATQETRWALENLALLLEEAGSSMDRVVSVTMLLTDKGDYDECNREYVKHWPAPGGLPSRSTALWGVPTDAKVAFSCVAVD